MQKVGGIFRLFQQLEAEPNKPQDEDVEAWLEYVFERDTTALKDFNKLMVQQQLK